LQDPSGIINAGAAYIFTRSGTTWIEQSKLTASVKASNGYFGNAVSISADSNTAIVGTTASSGAAYIFTRSGTTWTEQSKLTASDKAAGDSFGYAVSISVDGNTAIIGATAQDPSGITNAGAAYIFTRSGTTWAEQSKLTASDKAAGDSFGYAVSISVDGNTAIVGATAQDPSGIAEAGAAYVFAI
jgi:hypothetical protein